MRNRLHLAHSGTRILPFPRLVLLGAIAGVVLFGCTVNHAPRFEYGLDSEPIQFKRYEKHLAMDYIFHQIPVAYKRADALPLDPLLTEDQKKVLNEMGRPEYIRDNYKSESNEVVTDWAYVEKDKIYQFVEGQLVYEGELSDYDEMLIRRGRPNQVITSQSKGFGRMDYFRYLEPFTRKQAEYHFNEGTLSGKLTE